MTDNAVYVTFRDKRVLVGFRDKCAVIAERHKRALVGFRDKRAEVYYRDTGAGYRTVNESSYSGALETGDRIFLFLEDMNLLELE